MTDTKVYIIIQCTRLFISASICGTHSDSIKNVASKRYVVT